ncbi:transporter [Novosphingobium sp. TH158]|uniref:transporter n=1 Tax=Novosphingobium sp. TH158 TaxID=2067455 RepID=UPI001181AB0B|nr:transporter [Novosphingobium sp. TH158]
MTRTYKTLTLLLAASAMVPPACLAQASPGSATEPAGSLAAIQAELVEVKAREAAARARADMLEERLSQLEELLGVPEGDPALAEMRGRAMPRMRAERIADTVIPQLGYSLSDRDRTGYAAVKGRTGLQDAAEPERKSAAPTAAVEDVTRKEQGYFGNRLTIEPGLTYTHFDDARINLNGFLALDSIFLGRISIDDVSADILAADLTARYSLTPRLQFDVNVPFLYRHSTFSSGGAGGNSEGVSEISRTSRGLGDVNFGASYRLLQESGRRPDLVLNARVKAPTGKHPFGVELLEVPGSEGNLTVPTRLSTGSGVWGASVGLSALKTIDPMVVYGSVNYFHNFTRAFTDIDEAPGDQPGRARLGSAIQFGAGVAFALNDRSSLNLGYTQRLVRRTRIQRDGDLWRNVAGSQANVALMNIGSTFALDDRTTMIANVGIGLTDDAPNMIVSLRFPFRAN